VPYDGVVEVLRELKQQYKLGVVSSARRAQQAVRLYGLEEFFDVVVGGQDLEERKPHPAPVLLALERLHVKPGHAVMVGDLAVDVLAAKAAGIGLVVGVTHGFGPREALEAEGADHVVDSLPEALRVIEDFSK
jgi:HAD superfamily hydrolase (TIGR01509 family)